MIKPFEMFSESKKKGENGKRKFKMILYKIFPDSVIDTEHEVGTEYNGNGITWIEEYCRKALDSIKGMFLRCEFLDDERTEICGHGFTEIVDDQPLFENATTIGVFTDGYIDEIEENGEKIKVCIGVGEIDSSCYHKFCEKLDECLAKGIYPQGSVEILKTPGNQGIVYKYGYKEKGRIPMDFIHSGYALLNIAPADSTAKLLELNEHKEDKTTMTDVEMNALVDKVVATYTNQEEAIAQAKAECAQQIAEINEQMESTISEKNELAATVDELKAAIEKWKADFDALTQEREALWAERDELQKALGEAKAKERLGEMNAAIADFSDTEKEYAKAEIDAFTADPINSEINSIVGKIYEGIGKAAKADAAQKEAEIAEQNSKQDAEDIFGIVETSEPEDTNIF